MFYASALKHQVSVNDLCLAHRSIIEDLKVLFLHLHHLCNYLSSPLLHLNHKA